MGMLSRLRDAHPETTITAFNGHYAPIGDDDMNIVSHIRVERGDQQTSIAAVESRRRKQPSGRAIEERFERLVAEFERRFD